MSWNSAKKKHNRYAAYTKRQTSRFMLIFWLWRSNDGSQLRSNYGERKVKARAQMRPSITMTRMRIRTLDIQHIIRKTKVNCWMCVQACVHVLWHSFVVQTFAELCVFAITIAIATVLLLLLFDIMNDFVNFYAISFNTNTTGRAW